MLPAYGFVLRPSASVNALTYLEFLSALYHGKLATKLPDYVAGAVIPLGLPATSIGPLIGALTAGNVAGAEAVPGVTLTIIEATGAAISQAFADSFRLLWAIEIAFCAIALVLCVFGLEPVSKLMTQR